MSKDARTCYAAPGVMPCFPGNLGQANGLSPPSRPEIPITGGGPNDHGRSIAPGPAHAAPGLLLSQQIIGVGLDEQFHERRMHDAPPPGPAAVLVACRALHRVEDRARPLIHSASTVMPRLVQVFAAACAPARTVPPVPASASRSAGPRCRQRCGVAGSKYQAADSGRAVGGAIGGISGEQRRAYMDGKLTKWRASAEVELRSRLAVARSAPRPDW